MNKLKYFKKYRESQRWKERTKWYQEHSDKANDANFNNMWIWIKGLGEFLVIIFS